MDAFDFLDKAVVLIDLPFNQVTKGLINNLIFDMPLTVPETADFGVATDDHYYALRDVVRWATDSGDQDISVLEELSEAYGNGEKIEALVKKYAPRFAHLKFETVWDGIPKGPRR